MSYTADILNNHLKEFNLLPDGSYVVFRKFKNLIVKIKIKGDVVVIENNDFNEEILMIFHIDKPEFLIYYKNNEYKCKSFFQKLDVDKFFDVSFLETEWIKSGLDKCLKSSSESFCTASVKFFLYVLKCEINDLPITMSDLRFINF